MQRFRLCNAGFCQLAIFLLLGLSMRAQTNSAPQAQVPATLDFETARSLMFAFSPVLHRDQQAVGVARGRLTDARKLPNPEIEAVSESYPLFERNPGPFFDNQELTLRAGQTIETAAKRKKRTAVASEDLHAAEFEYQNVVRELTRELKSRYFSVALAQAQVGVARDSLAGFDNVLAINEARYKQGEISGLEFTRLQSERYRFLADLNTADLQLKNARSALLELLGFETAEIEFAVSEPLGASLPALDLEQLKASTENGRPDLVAQRFRVGREQSNVRLQQALAIPNVTPSFGYKRDFLQNTVTFGLSFPLPLFNRNQGGVASANAEAQRQAFDLTRLRLQTRREVIQAFNTVQAQNSLIQALQQTYVPNARKIRTVAEESFRLGAIDLIGLIDAERTFRETMQNYNQALFNQRLALADLESAVGKDLR